MTNIGMNLTEYTGQELKILTRAIIREQVFGGYLPDSKEMEMLKQWEVKLIEATVTVAMREHIASN